MVPNEGLSRQASSSESSQLGWASSKAAGTTKRCDTSCGQSFLRLQGMVQFQSTCWIMFCWSNKIYIYISNMLWSKKVVFRICFSSKCCLMNRIMCLCLPYAFQVCSVFFLNTIHPLFKKSDFLIFYVFPVTNLWRVDSFDQPLNMVSVQPFLVCVLWCPVNITVSDLCPK
jgi:hypothetical protein